MADPCTSAPLTSTTGIRFWELTREGKPETARESYGRDNSQKATRLLVCAWIDRLKFIRELKGGVSSSGTYQGPQKYPDVPTMLVASVDVEGLGIAGRGGASSQASYDNCVLRVEYETPPFREANNSAGKTVLISETLDYNAEFITIPDGKGDDEKQPAFVWTSTPTKELSKDALPAKIQGMAEYTVQLHRHLNPPWGNIGNALGHVNNGTFAPLSLSFADGFLLFVGAHTSHQFLFDPLTGFGITLWDLTYKFAWRQYRWNTTFRPKTGVWEDFEMPSGDQLYLGADMMTLLAYS